MLIVAALGDAQTTLEPGVVALAAIAREHQLVITYGNGPQVDLLALQSEAFRDVRTYPLDVLGVPSDGMIGSRLEGALGRALGDIPLASLITQTVVDALDPAFRHPSKPIGRAYSADAARVLAQERGWSVAGDGGNWHRVVASPTPRSIVELSTIRLLVERGVVVGCTGGGVPVVVDSSGARHGVEAVVDEDLAAALLARLLDADLLLLLTDAAAATASATKIEAATMFARCTGGRSMIGALRDAAALVDGTAGACIEADVTAPLRR